MKAKNKNRTPILLTCMGTAVVTVVASIIVGISFANHGQKQEPINAPAKDDNSSAGNSPAIIYGVGSNADFTNGNIKFLSVKNNVAALSFTNKKAEDWEPELKIRGLKYIDGTKRTSYTLTNKDKGYDSKFVLYDALKYTIDGKKSDVCVIPADGKEHIVEIDYSYLEENGIELDSELKIDLEQFMLRADELYPNVADITN